MMKIVVMIMACLAFASGCITPEDVVRIDGDVARLERQQNVLKQKVEDLEKEKDRLVSRLDEFNQNRDEKIRQTRDQSADLYVTVNRLKDEIQLLNGRLEEAEYQLRQKLTTIEGSDRYRKDKLDSMAQSTKSIDERISRLERRLNIGSSEKVDSKKEDDARVETEASVDQLYMSAKQAFDKNDIETARQGFQKLIDKYPKSKHADNAQFWIGEIYYREKWYEKAILEYQKVIENYPAGNKVQASLLKQGFAFYNLQDKANARLILNELVTKYPTSSEAKIAKEKLKELK